MSLKNHPDYIFFGTVIGLITIGIIILSSVSFPLSQKTFGSSFYYLKHQIIYALLPGLILGFLFFKIKLEKLKKLAPWLLLINLILLIMVFLPGLGMTLGGSSRWVNLGFISFQPSEFLKITFLLYLASWLDSRTRRSGYTKTSFNKTFFAFVVILGVLSIILILQPDISTLGIILMTSIIMFFLTNIPFGYTLFIVLMSIILVPFLIKNASYRLNRILVFLNPEIDPMGIGYQIKQALIAVGSGGIFGKGLGLSQQKFNFLPQSISDSIFAIFAEETGFIGCFVLILFFILFLWRGFIIGKNSHDKFSQLTAFGITSWVILQAFVNIGAMIGILPLTGLPLPFISYGGSALITELAGVGILLNISRSL